MKSWLTAILLLLCCAPVLRGQNIQDALRYSFVFPQGSARFAGTGGSLTPLGVDYTTLHTNPAGIGWNRNSSVHVSPGLSFNNTETELFIPGFFEDNERQSDSRLSFNLPSAGAIFAGTTRSVNWSTLNFGIGITQLADYSQNFVFRGRSDGGIIQAIAEDINDGILDPFRSDLIIDIPNVLLEDEEGFFTDFELEENEGATILREGRIERRGGMSEVAFGFGGNYRDVVMWGLSFGVPFFNYEEVNTYDELDDENQVTFGGGPGFESAGFDQNLTANGTGFNVKAGVIFRPTDGLRISTAVHTPTFWSIDEEYFTTLSYNFTADGIAQGGSVNSDISVAALNLRTPWRFMLGAGYLVGKSGFVSFDADYSNYGSNEFSFDDFATLAEGVNNDIDLTFQGSLGVRLGGELNLSPFQVRAGVGYRQLPYREFINDENEGIISLSAGLGYSVGKFFVDAAVSYEQYSSFQDAYSVFNAPAQTVIFDRTRVFGILTVGFRGFNFGL